MMYMVYDNKSSKLFSYLALVTHVLQLMYNRKLGVFPVVNTRVKLSVQGLKVFQRPLDEPFSAKSISCQATLISFVNIYLLPDL